MLWNINLNTLNTLREMQNLSLIIFYGTKENWEYDIYDRSFWYKFELNYSFVIKRWNTYVLYKADRGNSLWGKSSNK
jgi:hypothetical protein